VSDTTEITCARHPDTPTRLFCSECGTPICPRCLITTAVGQKCPECARQKKAAVRRGKPEQYLRGVPVGLAAAVAAAFLLAQIYASVGFFRAIITGLVGYGIAKAVLWGAQNNRADPFRNASMVFAVGASLGAWVLLGVPADRLLSINPIFTYVGAAYGVWVAFNR
jgi:uncharacterized membrane protein YeaQ/YmgE (transglycosylase-associated protein family)